MRVPSGEKYGSVSASGVAVSRRAAPPARGTTQRSPAYSKATRSLLTVGRRRRRVPSAATDVDAIAQNRIANAAQLGMRNLEFGILVTNSKFRIPNSQ